MRVPVSLAWLLLLSTFFTAGLLRKFNEHTPQSPHIPAMVGSMLFACIFFLLLVAAREHRRGAVAGPGIRLGSLTPTMLMLLMEKWVSLSLYNPVFYALAGVAAAPALLDAQFRAFAGVALILICLLVSRLSVPSARRTWRLAAPGRLPSAVIATATIVGMTYGLLALLSWIIGGGLRLQLPSLTPLLVWILAGQAVLAFAEELYYRGLLMSEVQRLAPRLGLRSATGRRWAALLTTSALFAMEHLAIHQTWDVLVRQLIFTGALGILFGLLVMASANLHFAAGVHAWINWLLLGAAPQFVNASGQPALPAGTYIGLTLIFAFVVAMGMQYIQRLTTTEADPAEAVT